MEEMITNITNLGFSIVVSIYLLVRLESKMDRLTESINQLTFTIKKTEG